MSVTFKMYEHKYILNIYRFTGILLTMFIFLFQMSELLFNGFEVRQLNAYASIVSQNQLIQHTYVEISVQR